MRVITRFQNPYDKYLFEGIIKPEDYYGTFTGMSLNNNIIKTEQGFGCDEEEIKTVSLYVLNTLDHNIKVEPDNPDNIITRFFSSMEPNRNSVLKNILLISVQHIKLLHEIIDYFTSLEKAHRPNENVMIYTISSLDLFNTVSSESGVFDIINNYGKHTFIDLSLALTAIELFKRRKLDNIYNSKDSKVSGGIGLDLLNHNDKKIKLRDKDKDVSSLSSFYIYVPKFKITEKCIASIYEFLNPEITVLNKSEESYVKRLVPMTPIFNYRLYDKLETFYIKSLKKFLSQETLKLNVPETKTLYNILILKSSSTSSLSISFKILLYISIFKWNLIFLETENPEENESLYNQLSNIYNDKDASINISRNELKKLNPDYSLLRTEEEVKFWDKNCHLIFQENNEVSKSIPHILIDKYNDIKTYIKKLESSLEVDNIKINVLEL